MQMDPSEFAGGPSALAKDYSAQPPIHSRIQQNHNPLLSNQEDHIYNTVSSYNTEYLLGWPLCYLFWIHVLLGFV